MWASTASESPSIPTEVWPISLSTPITSARSGTTPSSSRCTPTPFCHRFRRWGFGAESLDFFSTTRQVRVGLAEVGGVNFDVEVAIGQSGTHSQPSWPDSAVSAKQVQPSTTQAEMLNDVENLHWLLNIAHLWLLCNDQVNIHISVNEIAICAASNSAFDTHQAVLLSSLEHCFRVQCFGFAGVVFVGLDPTYVLTSPEAPFSQTHSAKIKAFS